jgi:hypothetical protein
MKVIHKLSDDNVINLMDRKPVTPPPPTPIEYEIHFYPTMDEGSDGLVVVSSGFLKFGPQFIAILDGPQDSDPVNFSAATAAIQYIKKVDATGAVQGTLSL